MNLYFVEHDGSIQGFPIIATNKEECLEKFQQYLDNRVATVQPTIDDINEQLKACDELIEAYEENKDKYTKEEREGGAETIAMIESKKANLISEDKGLAYYEKIKETFTSIKLADCNIYKVAKD